LLLKGLERSRTHVPALKYAALAALLLINRGVTGLAKAHLLGTTLAIGGSTETLPSP
jgi:hypothetical protein